MAGTVFVSCKVPNGLVCEIRFSSEFLGHDKMSAAQAEKNAATFAKFEKFVGKSVTLAGTKPTTVLHLPGVAPRHGGYGITEVDADFMAAWMELHADHPAVKNGLIFVAPTHDKAAGRAKEQAGVRSGFEPLSTSEKDLPAGIEPADKAA